MPETARISDPAKDKVLPDLSGRVGDNGPDRDEYLFLVGRMLDAEAKLAEARDHRKKMRQAAKLRGLDLQIVDLVEKMREEEDDTHFTRFKTIQRYAQYRNLPIGFQMKLFDEGFGGPSEQDLHQKAYESGRELGILGKNPDDQAYPPVLPEGQEHMRGWHDGQKVLHEKFLKLNADADAPEEKPAKKRGRKGKSAAEANGHAAE